MMIRSIFIAHDSISLNAQCAEGGGRVGGGEVIIKIEKKMWCKVIQRTGEFS